MQTFLPYPDFQKSAECLDYRRLGKQRTEAKQLLQTIYGVRKKGWNNHPALKMWLGYTEALWAYYNSVVIEWERRNYKNILLMSVKVDDFDHPPWFGDEKFHRSHRGNLLRKKPEWYVKFGWTDPIDLPYFWPVRNKS